jgi:hypothetical protein
MAGFTRPRYQRPERLGNRSRCTPASKKQCSSKAPRPRWQRTLSVLGCQGRTGYEFLLVDCFCRGSRLKTSKRLENGDSTAGMHAYFRVRQSRPITPTKRPSTRATGLNTNHVDQYLRDSNSRGSVSPRRTAARGSVSPRRTVTVKFLVHAEYLGIGDNYAISSFQVE